MEIAKFLSPEEHELRAKRSALAALESELAGRELELATLRGVLSAFEKKYLSIVGKCYAELDEVLAQIAEVEARRNPKNEAANQRAAQARQQARESAHAAATVEEATPSFFQPSDALRGLYRKTAKALHPDLADCDDDRARRHSFMARANQAYEHGDESGLQAVLREWESSPESVKGDGVAAELVRTIRKIARVEERLRAINAEVAAVRGSGLFALKTKAEDAEKEGRDLLSETTEHLAVEIAQARERLAALTK